MLIIGTLQPQTPTKLVEDITEIIKKENDITYRSDYPHMQNQVSLHLYCNVVIIMQNPLICSAIGYLRTTTVYYL